MNEQATQYREEIKTVIKTLNAGDLTYDEAKEKAQPSIDAWNKLNLQKSKEIAKKYGMKPCHRNINFASLVRSPELLW